VCHAQKAVSSPPRCESLSFGLHYRLFPFRHNRFQSTSVSLGVEGHIWLQVCSLFPCGSCVCSTGASTWGGGKRDALIGHGSFLTGNRTPISRDHR
jgi:hypothetical protein